MSNVDVQGLGVALGCTVLMACGGLSDRADGKNHDASGGTESGGAAGGANGAAGTETVRGGGPSAGGSSGSGGTAGTDPGGTGAGGEPDVGGAGGQPETTRLFVNGLAFGNDGFVATAEEDLPNGIDYGGVIFRSSDGLTWERVLTDELVPFDVEFGNGVFVSLAKRIDYPPGTWSAGGFVSSDGRTWTRVDVPASEPGQRMAFGNGTFIGVGDTGRLRSSDGMTWEAFGPTCEDGSHGVEFAAGRFVATDGWASTGESDDWEAIDFAPGDRLFSLYTLRAVGESFLGVSYYDCCFGEVPDAIRFRRLSSDDGLTWTLGDEERSQPPNIVLDDGNVCIAFRGVSVLSGPSCDALSVTFEGLAGQAAVGADGRYVVGGSGTSGAALIASTDGTTWTTVLRASE